MREIKPLREMTDDELGREYRHREEALRWATKNDCFADLARTNVESVQREAARRGLVEN